ncbi:MAG: UbiD family decarboxylase [Hyphomicrobiales bacterium]|nr:UbiD family decarboxylase [Hyphomicrobiales bacterium]
MESHRSNQVADLRSFIEALRAAGELKEIEGANCELEIGALSEYMADRDGPALLFDKVPGYKPGFRVLSNILNRPKLTALALGCPTNLNGVDLLKAWRKKFAELEPIPVRRVNDGPLLENVVEGDDVDVQAFPSPLWHEHDGGRYIGTGCAVITKDPDDGTANIGTYRVMVQDRASVSVKINKGKDGRRIMQKYHERGMPCPVAISVGQAPSLLMAGLLPIPRPEYEVAGGIQGCPVDVIKSPTTGLPLPASAEIVLEGEIPLFGPNGISLPQEGPFGEWPGYYADTTTGEVPLAIIKRIYYRNDPIILGAPPLAPPSSEIGIPLGAATLWDQLEAAGIPGITGVWGYVYGDRSGLVNAISIKQSYVGQSKQALLVAAGAAAGAYGGKFYIVVDDDVDIANPAALLWAIGTRCHVREAVDIVKSVWTSPADPALPPYERNPQPGMDIGRHGYTTDRVLIDACRPYRWFDKFPSVNDFPKATKEMVARKWNL